MAEKGEKPQDLAEGKEGRKEPRKRKKAMFKSIRDQMEFYLGDANMAKSAFLTKKILEADRTQEASWLDLDIFLTFNKLASMLREYFGQADTTDDLWKAVCSMPSEVYEVRHAEQGDKIRQIRRRKRIPEPEKDDQRVIYVEHLDPNVVSIEMLRHVFSKYGDVSYVSLPKFKHNGQPKGFAFVEFSTEEGAKNAMVGFIEAKRKIPSALDPSELQSIKSFHIEQDAIKSKIATNDVNEREKEEDEDEKQPQAKKQKLDGSEETAHKRKRKRKNNNRLGQLLNIRYFVNWPLGG